MWACLGGGVGGLVEGGMEGLGRRMGGGEGVEKGKKITVPAHCASKSM